MSHVFEDPEMQEIFEGYLIETQEILDTVSQDLMTLENAADDLDLLNRIFRSFHTIKGTSSFMGFTHISDITHHAEDLLNKLRKLELRVSQAIIDVLLDVQAVIQELVARVQAGDNSLIDVAGLKERIASLAAGEQLLEERLQEVIEQVTEIETAFGEIIQEENIPEENKASAVDEILINKAIGDESGDFSDDELLLITAAFEEMNQSLMNEHKDKYSQININQSDTVKTEDSHDEEAHDEEEHNEELPDEEVHDEEVHDESSEIAKIVTSEKTPAKQEEKTIKTTPPPAMQSSSKVQTDSIRVDVQRVESLMDLSGELVLGRNRLSQITETLTNEGKNKDSIRGLIETAAAIDFVTSEIQAAVMRMRMVPIGKLYQKAPRITRDLAKEFGKKINLVVEGKETEIDRGIIEELNDPLVHMIRNSCDHGIEKPEIRKAKGKSEEGTITLDAAQEGNNIVLKISDDGAGMDPEKLKNKAIERGILTPEQASQMSDREAFQLIFAPGFSTAAVVTAVSGRGVGMDVVRTNIQNLKGVIEIESELGMGSTFIIKLPLTLAIIQGLLVKVKDETYALPLSSVLEVVAIQQESVYSVKGLEVIRIRDEVTPVLRLENALNIGKSDLPLDKRNLVTVGYGIHKIGLVVDELLGQQEIVIKSLGEYLGNIKGIAGSTILGDGRVIMIIDVAELIQFIYDNKYLTFNMMN